MGKHEMRHHIVKEKYFKENLPNLLTWSEKEQIRHLASTQPDEWTPEKIAESFPVTAPIVKKLLKYPWKPATEQRIERHDASVMRNWKELKEGGLGLPENMRKHFLKFSERTIPPLNQKSIKIDITQEEKMGEFERIVQRCASQGTKENHGEKSDSVGTNYTTDNKNKVHKDNSRTTLDELTAKIKKRLETGQDVDLPDQIILNTTKTKTIPTNQEMTKEIELFKDEIKENKVTEYKEPDDDKSIMNYPEKINIPRKAYKKGATYKVNDCYYDHDGKFLYRVLGMC
ncbi:hypothetical protein O3G_MSEX001892 [Manduca sexta]|nr:hypothetical protein O3G_MSEX001892 [Manduca sexta]